jgi:prevent-host-death family protein
MTETLGVADAKRRFAELIDRVRAGERFVVTRRGRPVLALVPPDESRDEETRPVGLAALAGALADWDELDEIVEEIYASRRRARDRDVPDLG